MLVKDLDQDRNAVARLSQGDGTALVELYDRHGRAVYALGVRMLGDRAEAEDLTQDVFTLAWRNAPKYDGSRGAVAAWILVMARTRAIDRLRARRARPQGARDDDGTKLASLADSAPAVDAAMATSEEAARVRGALLDLPADQRTAVTMAYFEGLSHAEIAAQTGIPLGTIKTRIRTALGRLKDAMILNPIGHGGARA